MKKGEKYLTAFVVGGTGAVGKALTADQRFTKVTLFGRRSRKVLIPPPTENKSYEKFEQKIIDFDNLDKAMTWVSVPYGHSRDFIGSNIDQDYVVNSAKLAKEGETKHFHCITSDYANKNSWCFPIRIKGEVEDDLSNLGFERLSFYRPGFLLPEKREVSRLL